MEIYHTVCSLRMLESMPQTLEPTQEFTDLEYLCNSRTCLNNHDSTNNKICTAFRYSDEKISGNGGNCCEELSTFDTIYYNILDFFT